MSVFEGLGLTLFAIIFGANVILRLTSMIDVYVDTILTGIQRGIPVSKEHRWMTVYQQWLPTAANAMVFSSLLAGAMIVIGRNVDHDGVRVLAFASAVWAGIAALGWLVMCTSGVFYFASVLRKSPRQ